MLFSTVVPVCVCVYGVRGVCVCLGRSGGILSRESTIVIQSMPSSPLWGPATGFPSSPLDILWGSAGKGVCTSSQLLSLACGGTWHTGGPHKCTCWMNKTGKPLQNTLNNFRVSHYHFSNLDTYHMTFQNNSIPIRTQTHKILTQ